MSYSGSDVSNLINDYTEASDMTFIQQRNSSLLNIVYCYTCPYGGTSITEIFRFKSLDVFGLQKLDTDESSLCTNYGLYVSVQLSTDSLCPANFYNGSLSYISSTTLNRGTVARVSFSINAGYNRMLDTACDRFYFKRTA